MRYAQWRIGCNHHTRWRPLAHGSALLFFVCLAVGLGWLAPRAAPGADETTYSATVLADAPVGYWRLDESNGRTAYDSSGANRNGTYAAAGVALGASGALTGDPDTAAALGPAGSASFPTAGLNGLDCLAAQNVGGG